MDITELRQLRGEVKASGSAANDRHVTVRRERTFNRRGDDPVLRIMDTRVAWVKAIYMKLHAYVQLSVRLIT